MASGASTSSLTHLSVSASLPATEDKAGYEALSYTEVNDITDIGEFGPTVAEITHKPVNEAETYVFLGSNDNGSLALQMARSVTAGVIDAGQLILRTARINRADISVKIELNDNPNGTSNSVYYFKAKIMAMPVGVGAADTLNTWNTTMRVSGKVVEVDPVA